jgi:hypothetical protein
MLKTRLKHTTDLEEIRDALKSNILTLLLSLPIRDSNSELVTRKDVQPLVQSYLQVIEKIDAYKKAS